MAQTPRTAVLNLDEQRARLLEERARLLRVEQSQQEQLTEGNREGSENELAHFSTFDPADNADNGARLADTERNQIQVEEEKELISLIDHALDRLENGLYGICEVTGKPIPTERLRALPWATTTVEGAQIQERTD